MTIEKNKKYTLTITDIGTNGEGVGKIDGYTLFVKNALPDEEVEILVLKANKKYGYGKIIKILKPSPFRVDPLCDVAGKCGGCSLQHLDYKEQLKYKTNKVYQNLMRIGGFDKPNVLDIIGMDNPYNYRNKAQYPVSFDNKLCIGFYATSSHRVIDNDNQCVIGNEANKHILDVIKQYIIDNKIPVYDEKTHKGIIRHILIRNGYYSKEIMICLVVNTNHFDYKNELVSLLKDVPNVKSIVINYNTNKTNVILGESCETLWGNDYICDKIGDLSFKISPLSFFQVNPLQTQKLYNTALKFADLKGDEVVIDAYCGIGTISLFLAQKAKKVYGVEIIQSAIDNAVENAKINDIHNASFLLGKAEEVVPQLYNNDVKADVVVVDPPRKGCDESLLKLLAEMSPNKIVYISCDSATLARDLKYICNNKYVVDKVQPVDMFSQSMHVETVVLMSKSKK